MPSGRGWRSAHLPLRAPEVIRQAGQRPTRPGAVAGPPVTVALPSGGPRLQRRPATPHSVLAFESRQGPRSPLMPGSRTSHNPTTSPTSHGTRAPRGPSAAEWATRGGEGAAGSEETPGARPEPQLGFGRWRRGSKAQRKARTFGMTTCRSRSSVGWQFQGRERIEHLALRGAFASSRRMRPKGLRQPACKRPREGPGRPRGAAGCASCRRQAGHPGDVSQPSTQRSPPGGCGVGDESCLSCDSPGADAFHSLREKLLPKCFSRKAS